ncbi:MAG: hypothetical protein NZ772_14645 [Cyanobacteria bacterium]|nr:hypothetical protein [Cyanobacteriota bacterium]MDW8202613.1 hypothetical protein [Cyanobacteriota bacterium SKYGB_h_bin112]
MTQGLTAIDLMVSPVQSVSPTTTIGTAHSLLHQQDGTDVLIVSHQDYPLGQLSRHDLDMAVHYGFAHAHVQDFMRCDCIAVTADTPIAEMQALVADSNPASLVVLEHDRLVGYIPRHRIPPVSPASFTDLDPAIPAIPLFLRPLLHQRLPSHLWQLLNHAADFAIHQGLQLYLIGGAIRDLLLGSADELLQLHDIDLVVEPADGQYPLASGEAASSDGTIHPALQLAMALHQLYPEAKLQGHSQFQTADLLWHSHPIFNNLCVDIATARTEFYSHPADNPQVRPCTIAQDLHRRDFTINTLATRLTSHDQMPLLDAFGGYRDLQAATVRVLHPTSFIEDPTRIYRAVRFSAKLGFQLESRTEHYIRYAVAQFPQMFAPLFSGKGDRRQWPALGSRLKNELKYILKSPNWQSALKLLADLDALTCLHPTLKLTPRLWHRLRLIHRCFLIASRHSPSISTSVTYWEYLLETLIADLEPQYRSIVARNLQCSLESCDRLDRLEHYQQEITDGLKQCDRPSQVVHLLKPYNTATLVIVGVYSDQSVRKQIWRYLSYWRFITSPLDGSDLQALGYQPGKQFRQMLEELVVAVLDGTINADSPEEQRHQAEQFLSARYTRF